MRLCCCICPQSGQSVGLCLTVVGLALLQLHGCGQLFVLSCVFAMFCIGLVMFVCAWSVAITFLMVIIGIVCCGVFGGAVVGSLCPCLAIICLRVMDWLKMFSAVCSVRCCTLPSGEGGCMV